MCSSTQMHTMHTRRPRKHVRANMHCICISGAKANERQSERERGLYLARIPYAWNSIILHCTPLRVHFRQGIVAAAAAGATSSGESQGNNDASRQHKHRVRCITTCSGGSLLETSIKLSCAFVWSVSFGHVARVHPCFGTVLCVVYFCVILCRNEREILISSTPEMPQSFCIMFVAAVFLELWSGIRYYTGFVCKVCDIAERILNRLGIYQHGTQINIYLYYIKIQYSCLLHITRLLSSISISSSAFID